MILTVSVSVASAFKKSAHAQISESFDPVPFSMFSAIVTGLVVSTYTQPVLCSN